MRNAEYNGMVGPGSAMGIRRWVGPGIRPVGTDAVVVQSNPRWLVSPDAGKGPWV